MPEPIEGLYFNWLCAKVFQEANPTPSNTYWCLLRTLYSTEFVYVLQGDSHRVADGLDLRSEFLIELDIPPFDEFMLIPCSVLEMLIALSRRAEFQTDEPARDWFWEFLDNMGLKAYNDANGDTSEEITEVLNIFIWRTYRSDGYGGIFPIVNPLHDQRKVEIWYQLCEYLNDQHRF